MYRVEHKYSSERDNVKNQNTHVLIRKAHSSVQVVHKHNKKILATTQARKTVHSSVQAVHKHKTNIS